MRRTVLLTRCFCSLCTYENETNSAGFISLIRCPPNECPASRIRLTGFNCFMPSHCYAITLNSQLALTPPPSSLLSLICPDSCRGIIEQDKLGRRPSYGNVPIGHLPPHGRATWLSGFVNRLGGCTGSSCHTSQSMVAIRRLAGP